MNRLTLRHRLLLLTLLPSALIAIALVIYFTFSGIRTLEGELRLCLQRIAAQHWRLHA